MQLLFILNLNQPNLSLFPFTSIASSIGFAIALKLHFIGFLKFLLWVVFVDCIGVGLVIASLLW